MDTPSKSVSAAISIRPAESGDRAAIAELLSASKLVPLDETAQFGPQYAVAVNEDGMLVGVAGYERYGRDILLRSVAVSEAWRSTGIGARLTADRLAHALAQGCGADYFCCLSGKRHRDVPFSAGELNPSEGYRPSRTEIR
jgi:N-acetylglutamate synthase-like GNAT family acetyltransferase